MRIVRPIMWTLLVILILVGMFLASAQIWPWRDYRALKSGVQIGWTRQQVIQHLGTPRFTEKSLKDIRWSAGGWYPVPTRPVDNEVLVYDKTFWRAYVYIDKHNRVTYIHMSRT